MTTVRPAVEQLEDRCVPIVHSFSAGALASGNPAAAGAAATQAILTQSAVAALPVPVAASAGQVAIDYAPGRDVLLGLRPR